LHEEKEMDEEGKEEYLYTVVIISIAAIARIRV
jgi:hypothetical protein